MGRPPHEELLCLILNHPVLKPDWTPWRSSWIASAPMLRDKSGYIPCAASFCPPVPQLSHISATISGGPATRGELEAARWGKGDWGGEGRRAGGGGDRARGCGWDLFCHHVEREKMRRIGRERHTEIHQSSFPERSRDSQSGGRIGAKQIWYPFLFCGSGWPATGNHRRK
jgi:hypothetical protein